jgi:hypothetical protein
MSVSLVAAWHLLVKDTAAGGHPLHISRGHLALVAETVAVLDRPASTYVIVSIP